MIAVSGGIVLHASILRIKGVHFDVKIESVLQSFVTTALTVFLRGVDSLAEEQRTAGRRPLVEVEKDCQSSQGDRAKGEGSEFYRCV